MIKSVMITGANGVLVMNAGGIIGADFAERTADGVTRMLAGVSGCSDSADSSEVTVAPTCTPGDVLLSETPPALEAVCSIPPGPVSAITLPTSPPFSGSGKKYSPVPISKATWPAQLPCRRSHRSHPGLNHIAGKHRGPYY